MHTYQVKLSSSSSVAGAYWMSSSSSEEQIKPKSYNQPHKEFKPKSRELFFKKVWPSNKCSYITTNWFEKENWHKPNIPCNPFTKMKEKRKPRQDSQQRLHQESSLTAGLSAKHTGILGNLPFWEGKKTCEHRILPYFVRK